MRDADQTPEEEIFFEDLVKRIPGLDDWYHADPDGTLWMVASYDFATGSAIQKTLRVDYDGRSLRGGWSPSCLNWDDGVRADEALIDTTPPEGLRADAVKDPRSAATLAATWFEHHIHAWHARNG
jgi:hypothetical protein